MMWDLFAPSPHFYDINYNPEFFYRYKLDGSEQWFDLGPFEHESNGLGGELERSWYKSSVRYHTRTEIGERAKVYWDIKAWIPWHSNGNTDQIERYRGIGELNVTLSDFLGPFFEKGDLILRIYPGGASAINPVYGGQELTFRAKARYRAFLPLFVAQIFHGYGENLLDLQDNRWGIRAGIGF
jgi:outer membrane phospholipase A